MRVIAYGGGVQSTALIILAAQGRIEPVDGPRVLVDAVGDQVVGEQPVEVGRVDRTRRGVHPRSTTSSRRDRMRQPAAVRTYWS